MTEEQEKSFYQANIRLTILYILPDICEALMKDIEDYRKDAGIPAMRFMEKKNWKAFFKASRDLRSVIRDMPEQVQVSYADVCEMLQKLLMVAVDRCSENTGSEMMQKFIDFIETFPSERGITFKH